MASTTGPGESPATWERLWFALSGANATAFGMGVEVITPDLVRLPQAPWFRLNAAKGDIFRVHRGEDDQLWAGEKVESAGYCAIKLLLAEESPLGDIETGAQAMVDQFAPLAVTGLSMFGLAVIDVPPTADLPQVRHLLDRGRRDGWWDYEELCITDAWKTTG